MRKRTWRGRDEVREAARRLRHEQTPAEEALWELLRDHRCGGYGFRRQVPIGPFVVDFYCASVRLAIEVDGEVHDDPAVLRRDAERQEIIEQAHRIRLLRFRNYEVLTGDRAVLIERIISGLKGCQSDS